MLKVCAWGQVGMSQWSVTFSFFFRDETWQSLFYTSLSIHTGHKQLWVLTVGYANTLGPVKENQKKKKKKTDTPKYLVIDDNCNNTSISFYLKCSPSLIGWSQDRRKGGKNPLLSLFPLFDSYLRLSHFSVGLMSRGATLVRLGN